MVNRKQVTLTICLVYGDSVVWKTIRTLNDKFLYRLGVEQYDKVAMVAAGELFSQISKDKRKDSVRK